MNQQQFTALKELVRTSADQRARAEATAEAELAAIHRTEGVSELSDADALLKGLETDLKEAEKERDQAWASFQEKWRGKV